MPVQWDTELITGNIEPINDINQETITSNRKTFHIFKNDGSFFDDFSADVDFGIFFVEKLEYTMSPIVFEYYPKSDVERSNADLSKIEVPDVGMEESITSNENNIDPHITDACIESPALLDN